MQNEDLSLVHHCLVHMADQSLRRCVEKKKAVVDVSIEIVENGGVEHLLDGWMELIETDEIGDVGDRREWWCVVEMIVNVEDGAMSELVERLQEIGEKGGIHVGSSGDNDDGGRSIGMQRL